MTFTYPSVTTIDTFYTNDEGMLITPEMLEYGTGYKLVEVSAPYGYGLSNEAVSFDVTEDNSTEEDAVRIVEVRFSNMPQKGVIRVSKSGEVFATVTESSGIYQPVYEVQGLPGAAYEITAAEDIYTPDGTLRYSAGEVVDTVITGEDGVAESKLLYLGKYEVRETEAPYGMVINAEVYSAELVYAGQEIEITDTAVSFMNDRQKAGISLAKVLEQNKQFGIGLNDEISAITFGFYAAEDITAVDGSVIPADGLIEIMSLDENGESVLNTDLPFGSYYVQEISTDCHYILSDEKYPVVFGYLGQDISAVSLQVNGGSITNDLIYGEINGLKKDENGTGLGGAMIGLFTTTGEEPILTTISADDGSFAFKDVPYGEYVVREMRYAYGTDARGRYRNKIIAFRVSPEEAKLIEVAASVTGMFKQDYYISKLLDRTVVVQGSCKIHRALYDRLTETLEELKRIEAGSGVDPDLLEIIQTITQIVDNLYIK